MNRFGNKTITVRPPVTVARALDLPDHRLVDTPRANSPDRAGPAWGNQAVCFFRLERQYGLSYHCFHLVGDGCELVDHLLST